MKNNHGGIKGRVRSFRFAFKGFAHLLRDEPNSLIHLLAAVAVLLAGYCLDIAHDEWLWIISAIALVFITEMLNTAIENLVDLLHPEYHPMAGKVKDICAGAVLLAALYALIVAAVIFIPHIL